MICFVEKGDIENIKLRIYSVIIKRIKFVLFFFYQRLFIFCADGEINTARKKIQTLAAEPEGKFPLPASGLEASSCLLSLCRRLSGRIGAGLLLLLHRRTLTETKSRLLFSSRLSCCLSS